MIDVETEIGVTPGVTGVGPRHLHDKDDEWEGGEANAGKTVVAKEGTLRRAKRLYGENGPAELGEPSSDGFHPWHGGSIPVSPYTVVQVQFRGGFVTRSGDSVQASAFRFDWEHTGGNDDIVGFKPVDEGR